MRVVIVCDPGHVDGGAPKVAIASARALAEAGMDVIYVCATGPVSADLSHPGITVHCLNFENVWKRSNALMAAAQGIWNRAAKTALEEILARLPRDETIVHFHQWTKAFSPSVLDSPSRFGLPSAVSLHDYFLACPNGAYYRFPQGVPCAVTPMSAACIASRCDSRSQLHKMVRVARQLVTNKALRRAASSLSVISVSSFAQNVIAGFIPLQHKRYVVRSPIEIVREAPVSVKDNCEFVFVGRMTEEKGVRQLAKAASRAGLPLTFAGDGPLRDEIENYKGAITCTGWVDAAALNKIMKRARALVFPSTWPETGGLVVLEAVAQGIPVIVSRRTAPSDLIADGENGYLIDPDDGAMLEARMRDLATGPAAERMGLEAYNRYWANPQTAEAHVSNLLLVYEDILREYRRAGVASAA
jgi:glycosyltransferase involved in cell wall biosynthesis